jgi:hypothetical protein
MKIVGMAAAVWSGVAGAPAQAVNRQSTGRRRYSLFMWLES